MLIKRGLQTYDLLVPNQNFQLWANGLTRIGSFFVEEHPIKSTLKSSTSSPGVLFVK